MKIKDLIEILQRYDPEQKVVFKWDASYFLPSQLTLLKIQKCKPSCKPHCRIHFEDGHCHRPEGIYLCEFDAHTQSFDPLYSADSIRAFSWEEGDEILAIEVENYLSWPATAIEDKVPFARKRIYE